MQNVAVGESVSDGGNVSLVRALLFSKNRCAQLKYILSLSEILTNRYFDYSTYLVAENLNRAYSMRTFTQLVILPVNFLKGIPIFSKKSSI